MSGRSRYDAALADISRQILIAPHREDALATLPDSIAYALHAEGVAILLADAPSMGARLLSSTGMQEPWKASLLAMTWFADLAADTRDELKAGEVVDFRLGVGATSRHAVVSALPDRLGPLGYLIAWLPVAGGNARIDHARRRFIGSVANVLAAALQRARSEEQLAHAQRLDALGQLTGGIAHDLNNLLTIISGNLQLLDMACRDSPDTADTVASALRAVERGSALTRKLRGFARRQRLLPRAVRPELLLADLGDMLGRTLGEHIVMVADCPDDLPAVFADPGELEAALINLSLNARDAMEQGGRLRIAAREATLPSENESPAGPFVVFSVADTGCGMPANVLAHAFEPFFTTKDAGKGNGLGLSMVYGFVRQSLGRLAIDSQVGRGTCVEIALPVASARDPAGSRVPPVHGGGGSVLVVEDEPEVRRIAAPRRPSGSSTWTSRRWTLM